MTQPRPASLFVLGFLFVAGCAEPSTTPVIPPTEMSAGSQNPSVSQVDSSAPTFLDLESLQEGTGPLDENPPNSPPRTPA